MKSTGRIGLILRIGLSVIGAVIAIAIAAFFLIPADVYRGPIEQAAEAATGRALHLRGPVGFTIYPEIGISVSDATFANAPGAREPEMVTVGRIVAGVRLMPLFSRRVEITRVILEKPVVHMEVGRDGVGNWVFVEPRPAAQSQAGATANFSLSNLRIQDGTFSYFDARTGKGQQFDHVDVAIDTTSLEQPFSVKGAATYRGHRLDIAGKLGNLGDALKQAETPASVSVSSDIFKMTLDGAVGGKTTAAGKLHLDMASLRQFANWLDVPLPPAKGLGAMTLDASVAVEPKIFSASAIKLALDGMNVTGDFRLMIGDSKPAMSGKLAIDRLDLNPYMAMQTGGEPAPAKAAAVSTEWSDTPISFEMLRAFDADLGLNVGRILLRNIDLQKTQLSIALRGGVLNSTMDAFVIYQGAGKGSLIVDASHDSPIIKTALTANGLQVQPFLVAFVGVDKIVGTGNVSFDVTAQGASPKAIIASSGGKGAVTFKDGMIRGVDLAAVARTVQSALSGASIGEHASTDFAELGGTFTINKGVMNNTDFHLLNPFVRMTGNGTVDLAGQKLDFHIEPKLVASAQGQGGQSALAGIGIPFRVSGPWTKLSYGPDMQNVGKALTNTLIDRLTGGKNDTPSGAQSKPAVTDVLKGLFGR